MSPHIKGGGHNAAGCAVRVRGAGARRVCVSLYVQALVNTASDTFQ